MYRMPKRTLTLTLKTERERERKRERERERERERDSPSVARGLRCFSLKRVKLKILTTSRQFYVSTKKGAAGFQNC